MASAGSGKRPRGIRFTDLGYEKLQKATEHSPFTHMDDFILDLIKGKANKVRMEALLRKIEEKIAEGNQEVLVGMRKLLNEFTQPPA